MTEILEKNASAPRRAWAPIAVWVVALLLFTHFALRFWLNALGKPFWVDETMSLSNLQNTPFSSLLLNGQRGEASRSPLVYIVDFILAWFWDLYPQRVWDLRLFFRISHAAYWSLASAAIFVWVWKRLPLLLPNVGPWQRWLIAVGAAYFYYINSFMNIYAIESRAYSLWVSLSTIHLLLTIDAIFFQPRRILSPLYLLVIFLMGLTTYATFAQIALGLAVWHLARWEEHGWKNFRACFADLKISVWPLLAGAVPTFWYFAQYALGQFGRPPFSLYLTSVREVLLKSFHHHGVQPLWITGPLFCFLIPWLNRRRPKSLALYAFLFGNVLVSLALFLISRAKGGIYAPRYATYLIPTFTFFYLSGLAWIFSQIAPHVARLSARAPRLPRLDTAALLTIFFTLEIVNRVPQLSREILAGLDMFRARQAYGVIVEEEKCPHGFPVPSEEFEALNERCRGR